MATAENLAAAMVEGTLNNFDVPAQPYEAPPPPGAVIGTLQHAPGLAASMGLTAFRGSNTIIGGGWDSRPGSGGGFIGGSIRNNNLLNPRTWTRYGSQDAFFNMGRYTYSPFQFGAPAANWLNRHGAFGGKLRDAGDIVGRGSLSRITASARIGRMSERQFASAQRGGLGDFLERSGISRNVDAVGAQRALMTNTGGAISDRVGGFLSGLLDDGVPSRPGQVPIPPGSANTGIGQAAARRIRGELLDATDIDVSKRMGVKGGAQLLKRAAGKKLVGKAALAIGGKVALAATGVGAVPLAIWGAFDIAKMTVMAGGYMAKGVISTGLDAAQSYMGGMSTGIMETGFRETAATMTSRSRGVMAIQNSRLNARSILGSEAGAMHAHFG